MKSSIFDDFEIATGYFAKTKEYREEGYAPISISRYPPKDIPCGKWFTPAPSADLLKKYKENKITMEQYDKRYYKELDGKTVGLYDELCEIASTLKAKGIKKMVLLCYEKDNHTCHRALLEHYLNREYDLRIHEVGKAPDITPLQEENDRRKQENLPLVTDSYSYYYEMYRNTDHDPALDFYGWLEENGYELSNDRIADEPLLAAATPEIDELTI